MPTNTRIGSRGCAQAGALVLLLAGVLALPGAAGAAALAPGDQGSRVEALQRAFGVEVDGVYGEPLRVAVMRLQRAHGLPADGSVGPATWGLLVRIRARARRRAEAHREALAAAGRSLRRAGAARPRAALSVGWGAMLAAVRRLELDGRRALAGRGTREQAPTPAERAGRMRRTAAAAGRARRTQPRTRAERAARTRRPAAGVVQGPVLRIGLAADRVGVKHPRRRPALPLRVRRVIAAGDRIATMPYRYGGGHGNWHDSGYDCSGSVSYALHGGGLLDVALASGGFMSWGEPGRGRWISVYANAGHAFMVVAGRRFDTSGRDQTGSRWQAPPRGAAGYAVRHPAGL